MRAGGPHAIEIFHASRGRNGVDAGGMRQDLDLVGQSCRDILHNHKTGIKARVRSKEQRHILVIPIVRPHQMINPAFGEASQVSNCDSQHIEGQSQGLTVEIATA